MRLGGLVSCRFVLRNWKIDFLVGCLWPFFLAVVSFVRCEQDARRSELPAGQRGSVSKHGQEVSCASVCVCVCGLSAPLTKVSGRTMCVRTGNGIGTGAGDGGKTQLFFAVFVAFPFFLSLSPALLFYFLSLSRLFLHVSLGSSFFSG